MKLRLFDTLRYSFDLLDRLLFVVAIASTGVYYFYLNLVPGGAVWLIKIIPPVYLGLLSIKHVAGNRGLSLAAALFLYAAADVAFFLNESGGWTVGLLLLASSSLFYFLTFYSTFHFRKILVTPVLIAAVYIVVLYFYIIFVGENVPAALGVLFAVQLLMLIGNLFARGVDKTVMVGTFLFLLASAILFLNHYLYGKEDLYLISQIGFMGSYFCIGGGYLFDLTMQDIGIPGPGSRYGIFFKNSFR